MYLYHIFLGILWLVPPKIHGTGADHLGFHLIGINGELLEAAKGMVGILYGPEIDDSI